MLENVSIVVNEFSHIPPLQHRFPEHFKALVQPNVAETFALHECFCTDSPRAGGQIHLLDAAFRKRVKVYLLEAL